MIRLHNIEGRIVWLSSESIESIAEAGPSSQWHGIRSIICAGGRTYGARESVAVVMSMMQQHPDDDAVDRFATIMKTKLAEKRAEGRGGWDDPNQCTTAHLAELLRRHVAKGDPVDVGNFAMMLWNRGGSTNEGI